MATWQLGFTSDEEIELLHLQRGAARAVVVGVVASVGLVACSSGDSGGNTKEGATTVADAGDAGGSATEPGDEAAGDPEQNGAAEAGIDLTQPPDPIGEVMVPIDKDGIDETKVEVLEARKRGKVLLVTFRFTPEGTTSDEVSIFESMAEHTFAPMLIDLDNLKKYEYVPALTSSDVAAKVEVGESLYGFTAFPLPPDDLESIDVKVSELAPPIEDVPLP